MAGVCKGNPFCTSYSMGECFLVKLWFPIVTVLDVHRSGYRFV